VGHFGFSSPTFEMPSVTQFGWQTRGIITQLGGILLEEANPLSIKYKGYELRLLQMTAPSKVKNCL
jgi:hypothetical protein